MNLKTSIWFSIFKYSVYSFLILNVGLFLIKEVAANEVKFVEVGWSDMITAYASTIDTGAWVILLLLFELETFILPRAILKSAYRWFSFLIRGVCYCFIVYALIGYLNHLSFVSDFQEIQSISLCEKLGTAWMEEVDEFQKITKDNCVDFSSSHMLLKKATAPIYVSFEQWKIVRNLVWTDIFNSVAWMLIVLVLEIDVYLNASNNFTSWKYQGSRILKGGLYMIVLLAAIYWGYEGELLEFWDAFLWIVVFVFIETNLFLKRIYR